MLAIDIGNSKTAFGLCRGSEIVAKRSLATNAMNADAVAKECAILFAEAGEAEKEAFIAAVVPEAIAAVEKGVRQAGARAVWQIAPTHTIMPHCLRTPGTTGVDRLLAARAARDLYANGETKALIVIQAGTAVTIDAVDAGGTFVGGVILPGPRLWLDALSLTARIPRYAAEDADWRILMAPADYWPGRDSREAVLRGLAIGLPAAIGAVGRALAQSVRAVRYCLTGGWAAILQPLLPFSAAVAPDLVLHGIRLAASDIKRLERR
ncbi:MAG: type III pantothenate kinase [Planctomycetota bacterium]|nr:type III pantothenate kinase [Planctomycetota bacterium]